MERDPRFTEFLEDKLEHYPFAERLMDFVWNKTSKSNWEDFAEKVTVPIQCQKGAFSLINIIFRERYARVWASKRSKEPMDFAVSSPSVRFLVMIRKSLLRQMVWRSE